LSLLVAAGIEASRNDTEKASVITFRKVSRNDSSDSRKNESCTDKGNTARIGDESDYSSNSRRASNSRNDSSPNAPDLAGSGNAGDTGIRYGGSSETVETIRLEQAKRIRRLIEQGMSERWARQEVLADNHALDCDCEVCL
jgi:hypothetical protein